MKRFVAGQNDTTPYRAKRFHTLWMENLLFFAYCLKHKCRDEPMFAR